MSDNNDTLSIRLGARFLQEIGIPAGQIGADQDGMSLETSIVERLQAVRSDLIIERSRPAASYEQYTHLNVFPQFRSNYEHSYAVLDKLCSEIEQLPEGPNQQRLESIVSELSDHFAGNAELIDNLKREMPEESLLKIDVSVALPSQSGPNALAVALSAKWSLRTDRAQDCVSQGNKLVAQRRGRMPHFAVVTVETRPSMLRILADGSGAVDCIYHLDLPALQRTIEGEANGQERPASWSPKMTFDRLLHQRRIRDFDDLIHEIQHLPTSTTAQ
jgi:hypothetical protein